MYPLTLLIFFDILNLKYVYFTQNRKLGAFDEKGNQHSYKFGNASVAVFGNVYRPCGRNAAIRRTEL